MQIHQLQRRTPLKKSRQIGRGGKRGTTSGRGTKGQKARAGHKMRPELRDIIKKIPKGRGRGMHSLKSLQASSVAINLDRIERVFKTGDEVSPSTLSAKHLVALVDKKFPIIKILATGTISKPITFSGVKMSTAAKTKILAAGGLVK